MSTKTRQDQLEQVWEHDRNMIAVAVAALTGAVGMAIALGLAKATEYAEQVEDDEYCHGTDAPPRS